MNREIGYRISPVKPPILPKPVGLKTCKRSFIIFSKIDDRSSIREKTVKEQFDRVKSSDDIHSLNLSDGSHFHSFSETSSTIVRESYSETSLKLSTNNRNSLPEGNEETNESPRRSSPRKSSAPTDQRQSISTDSTCNSVNAFQLGDTDDSDRISNKNDGENSVGTYKCAGGNAMDDSSSTSNASHDYVRITLNDCSCDYSNFGDDESVGGNSVDGSASLSVTRRIKNWFGSFGKGNSKIKRDSQFFNERTDDPNSRYEGDSNSLSSSEGRNSTVESSYENKEYQTGASETDSSHNSLAAAYEKVETPELRRRRIIELADELFGPESNKEKKIFYIVKELISSEIVFIDVLRLLCLDFRTVVLDRDGLPDAELSKIINHLPHLLAFNEDLLRDMENRVNNWLGNPKISDIFVKKGPFLKLYSSYIRNFENQCRYLDTCCQKYNKFAKIVKDFESSERCKKLSIKHYMLKPIQRIPQYRLLLEDYLRHQEGPGSIDYKDTQAAIDILRDVAEHANRSVEHCAHLSKLLQLQSQLGNYEIIKPGREFVKSGELNKISRKEYMQPRHFILLNDSLLCTNFYGTLLRVNYELTLAGMKVYVPQVSENNNEFSVISVIRSFTLRARSEEERNEWVDALKQTIKDYNARQLSFAGPKFVPRNPNSDPLKLGKEAPLWIPDHRVTMCQSCTSEFTVTFRRHHCRACGKVVCGLCSDNKAPLQYMNFQTARVCDECYQYVYNEFKDPQSNICLVIKSVFGFTDDDEFASTLRSIETSFKKQDPNNLRKLRKYVPTRLKEVTANDSGSQMCGWLHKRNKKSWKRRWFVLKEQVLYEYKASEDVKALGTIPVLGYCVETFKQVSNTYEEIDSTLVFQLAHTNQEPVVFYADSEQAASRWVNALNEATSLA